MISYDQSYSRDDESDNGGSDSGSDGTCSFLFCFEESVGRVDNSIGRVDKSVDRFCRMGSDIFVPTGIKSIVDIVPLVV